jgi:hypothetical protein
MPTQPAPKTNEQCDHEDRPFSRIPEDGMTVRHRPLVSGVKKGALGSLLLVVAAIGAVERTGHACTAFCAVGNGMVLVGNNEDYTNPRTKIWFIPTQSGRHGRMYVGLDDLYPQGGMNDQGLWFDQFLVPPVRAAEPELPHFRGNLIDEAMATCATVDDVVHLFEHHNRSFLTETIVMFADASGGAVAIDPAAIVRGTGDQFVQTNFHQSRPEAERDARFTGRARPGHRVAVSAERRRRSLCGHSSGTHERGPGVVGAGSAAPGRRRRRCLRLAPRRLGDPGRHRGPRRPADGHRLGGGPAGAQRGPADADVLDAIFHRSRHG